MLYMKNTSLTWVGDVSRACMIDALIGSIQSRLIKYEEAISNFTSCLLSRSFTSSSLSCPLRSRPLTAPFKRGSR